MGIIPQGWSWEWGRTSTFDIQSDGQKQYHSPQNCEITQCSTGLCSPADGSLVCKSIICWSSSVANNTYSVWGSVICVMVSSWSWLHPQQLHFMTRETLPNTMSCAMNKFTNKYLHDVASGICQRRLDVTVLIYSQNDLGPDMSINSGNKEALKYYKGLESLYLEASENRSNKHL